MDELGVPQVSGKVVLVTGATAGIGKEVARGLAQLGATVVGVGRNAAKCASCEKELRAATGNPAIEYLVADLSLLSQVRTLAENFRSRHRRLDVLVNNAGAFYYTRRVTPEGFEQMFALNHLNYFLLTNLLLDMLRQSAPSRIVNVSSGAHNGNALNWNDLQSGKGFLPFRVYGRTKLANLLFTCELARRLEGTGVTANALHPGFVATDFGHAGNPALTLGMRMIQRVFGISPEEGARTAIHLAASPQVDGVSGRYFIKNQAVDPSSEARNAESARRLWEMSEQMVGMAAAHAEPPHPLPLP